MQNVFRSIAVACCAFAALHTGPALAEKRLALAVGIDVYDNLPAHEQLRKAVNDARAVAVALRDLGFEAAVEENLAGLAFARAWQRFLNRLEPGDTAALFFSGHGVEIGGVNYLLPRDVPKVGLAEDRVLARASIRFNDLMDDLRDKKVRIALFIVDACRDNPFRDERGRSVGGTRGLIRVEPAKGSFIMYSAGAGEKALDRLGAADKEPNSPYTRTLLPILKTPGLSLQQIATRVRAEVVELARRAQPPHEQTPAYYDQLLGEFVLKAGAPPSPPPPSLLPLDRAALEWSRLDKTSIAELETFERRHPASAEAEYARARLKELRKVAVVTPPPVVALPKVVEPAVGVFSPSRAARPLSVAEERTLKPKDSFRECNECPEMVVVPAGSFMMGSPPSEEGRRDAEGPQRRVTIARPFAVGKFEVTFSEWQSCVNGVGCSDKPDDRGWGRGRRPVINVSWDDITKEYLPWLSRETGKTYRLLTEAEWEYAARAGTTTPFSTGPTITTSQANFDGNYAYGGSAKGTYRQKTVDVGSFPPNAFGLHDMHGNVWEWVEDCWNATYSGAPVDGSAWTAGDCGRRVLRGGSWFNNPVDCRSALRFWILPVDRYDFIGFRLARTLNP